MIGDGSLIPITHTGFVSVPTTSKTLTLQNVLCVPSMPKTKK